MRETKNHFEVDHTQIGSLSSSQLDVLRRMDVKSRSSVVNKEVPDSPLHLRGGGDDDEIEYEFEDAFQTHRRNDIDIYRPIDGTEASVVSDEDERLFFADEEIPQEQLQRIADADPRYNCHGYTFANSKGWITDYHDVKQIIRDNKFQRTRHPEVNDVILYEDNVHSGIVVEINEFGPIIESKFGKYGVFRHYADTLSSAYGTYRYYRPDPNIGRVLDGAYDSE
jgi:hypothetical protein